MENLQKNTPIKNFVEIYNSNNFEISETLSRLQTKIEELESEYASFKVVAKNKLASLEGEIRSMVPQVNDTIEQKFVEFYNYVGNDNQDNTQTTQPTETQPDNGGAVIKPINEVLIGKWYGDFGKFRNCIIEFVPDDEYFYNGAYHGKCMISQNGKYIISQNDSTQGILQYTCPLGYSDNIMINLKLPKNDITEEFYLNSYTHNNNKFNGIFHYGNNGCFYSREIFGLGGFDLIKLDENDEIIINNIITKGEDIEFIINYTQLDAYHTQFDVDFSLNPNYELRFSFGKNNSGRLLTNDKYSFTDKPYTTFDSVDIEYVDKDGKHTNNLTILSANKNENITIPEYVYMLDTNYVYHKVIFRINKINP